MTTPARSTRTRWDPSALPPVVWFVGPWESAEFAGARPAIIDAKSCDFASPDTARAALAAGAPPEVVLLAQPRPGFWPQSEVDALLAAAPLARIVVVVGTWCEGEPRTGRPLVGALRLYWHELPAWWRQSLACRARGFAPHWSQPGGPRTRESSGVGVASHDLLAGQTIVVDAVDFAVFEALAAALHPYGAASVWAPRGRGELEGAAAGIFDGSQLNSAEVADLRRFCARFDRRLAPVIVLVDFPRAEHFDVLREAGARALRGKPYSVAALAVELARTASEQEVKDPPAPAPWTGGLGRGDKASTRHDNGSRVPSASVLRVASQELPRVRSGDFGSPVLPLLPPPQGEGTGQFH
jgi:hypothetical protein